METSSSVEAIIWDLDGTLLDSFDIYFNCLSEATTVMELPSPNRDTVIANYHGSLEDSIQAALGLPVGPLLASIIDEFLAVQHDYYEDPNGHLFSDALGLVKRAAQVGLAQFIITNRRHAGRGLASPRSIVGRSDLHGLIDGIVCGDETDAHKPDAAVAWPLLQRHSLDPRSVLVIGDQHVDAELARNLGCQAVIVGRTAQSPHLETIPDWRSFATSVNSLDTVKLS